MMHHIVFSPEAEEQLAALYRYIASAAASDMALRYTDAIITYCESLQTFPSAAPSAMTFAPACASPTIRNGP